MYTIKFVGNNATSGTMKAVKADGEITLPACKYRRKGFRFAGWSTKRNNKIDMKRFQLGAPKYKNKAKIKGKSGQTIVLYACWKGYGAEAAALWAVKIAKNNAFTYGTGKAAHHNGCFFCGTNQNGKYGKPKGAKYARTYCCNPFVMAALVHGANLFKVCPKSGLTVSWWLGLKKNGKPLYEKIGRNVPYAALSKGDILIKNKKHIMMFVGITKSGEYRLAQARREGWDKGSITITHPQTKRCGLDYIALRYIGR